MDNATLIELLKIMGAGIVGFGGKALYDFIGGKTKAETKQIDAHTSQTTIEMTDDMAREWMAIAKDANVQLVTLQRKAGELEIEIAKMRDLLIRGEQIMRDANIPGHETYFRDIKKLIANDENA